MHFAIETEQETDGRWIAEIAEIPGVLAYGATREEAIAAAEALARRTLADVEAAWIVEAERRLDELSSGRVQGIPLEEAVAEIRKMVRRPI